MNPDSQMDVVGTQRAVGGPTGLIGLGLLGMALAERLLGGGLDVWGYDVDPHRNDLFRRAGGKSASGAADITAGCRRILLSLPDSSVVETVVSSMNPSLTPGQIIVDTSTGEPEQASAMGHHLAERSVYYLDATISGSSQQVRQAEVIVMAGGPAKAFEQCQDLFRLFARRWFHLGPCGSGSRMKLVSNLVLGLNRAALAEGLWLSKVLGLDAQVVLTVLRESMAYSRIMDTKGQKMITGDFEPQARLSQHQKDVRLILQAAAGAGTDLPLTRAHAHLLELARSAGYGDQDNSAIIRAFEQLARSPSGEQAPGHTVDKNGQH